ncbi:hypothetical protein ACIQC0_10380 [Pseudarthrobacter sp. NPDC092419]|uniref:hypothetical protein n=1 Tax=Pseudarthrobacter sp. NPDC092419 TaxID=3364414 RepID=UPI003827A15B
MVSMPLPVTVGQRPLTQEVAAAGVQGRRAADGAGKLLAELRGRNPGDTVGFKIKRGDQSLDIQADLAERPTSRTTR